MSEIQRKLGDKSENYVANWFKAHKYWAYILPKKIGGQPFDIIAARLDKVWFADVKHLEEGKKSFTFDRIEPNQRTSMQYARNFCLIKNIGFIIQAEIDPSRLFWLSYDRFVEEEQNGAKSVKLETLEDMEELI